MVSRENSETVFAPGERVPVPWGLDVLEGTVVSSHGRGVNRRVVVSVDLPDAEGESVEQLVTLPVRVLESAAAVASERKPGAWLPAYRYEEELRHALELLVQTDVELSIGSLDRESAVIPGLRADFVINFGQHRLIIEAKALVSGRVSAEAVNQLLGYVTGLPDAAGLLVTNAELSKDARKRLQQAGEEGYELRAVKWRSQDDNPELGRVITELFPAA